MPNSKNDRILVLGATGFLGKRVCRKLDSLGLKYGRTSLSLGTDLRDQKQAEKLFAKEKPTHVLNCASYVGGIAFGYKHPAEIFRNNLLMTVNLLEACKGHKVKRLVNPISNCAYPAKAKFFKEAEFWDGPMHESVLTYGFARKASWVGAWAYGRQFGLDTINLILSNMYGPEDHFEEERSHAIGALIMKMVEAKRKSSPSITVWGTGKPVREWLFVDDGAEAMVKALDCKPYADILNIGVGEGISIAELAEKIRRLVGYEGKLVYDASRPDGAPYKTVDGSRAEKFFGWKPHTGLDEGLKLTIDWYMANRK
ncbi:GDP-L-fucose synthase [Candidatus Burarchaeum australiense]|nr:GDP-L-fucose synthase [Candidatus Burarchaeum australiense]